MVWIQTGPACLRTSSSGQLGSPLSLLTVTDQKIDPPSSMSATVYQLWVINKAGGLVYDKHLNRQSQSHSHRTVELELTRSLPPWVRSLVRWPSWSRSRTPPNLAERCAHSRWNAARYSCDHGQAVSRGRCAGRGRDHRGRRSQDDHPPHFNRSVQHQRQSRVLRSYMLERPKLYLLTLTRRQEVVEVSVERFPCLAYSFRPDGTRLRPSSSFQN